MTRRLLIAGACIAVLGAAPACSRKPQAATYATPEEAVQALRAAVIDPGKATDRILAIFGPDAQELVDTSDPVAARRNREVFAVAIGERSELTGDGERRTLVVGHESWPFPVPIVKEGSRWHFDTAAGLEEVIARRIGRNELAAIQVARTYVIAQRLYARASHDGMPAGLYAMKLRSDPGRQNGLYWPSGRGEKRSPLGELLTKAATEHTSANAAPAPFHGYIFRVLTEQGPSAPGGPKRYVAGDRLAGGFALVAWPAKYDVTGVMTFIVNQDGRVFQRDLGEGTADAAAKMMMFEPDAEWSAVE